MRIKASETDLIQLQIVAIHQLKFITKLTDQFTVTINPSPSLPTILKASNPMQLAYSSLH